MDTIDILRARVSELERLEALLREVSTAGVELDDPRIGYLTVQIDRVTWNEIKEIAALDAAAQARTAPPEVKP